MTSLPPCSCPPMASCERHGVVKNRTEKAVRNRAAKRGKPLKPGKGLAPKSEKKTITDMIHDAYRDAFIFLARRYDDLRCWECGIECTPKQLHLHHLKRRGQGGGHFAANCALVCNRFSANGSANCHDRLDGNDLRFTKESA